jgi:phosphoglycolate phosphatase-like HAD superfamily hydrolase
MTGLPLEAIFRLAWPDLTADLAHLYRTEYRDIYDREIIPATKLFDGARETLHAFHEAGLLQATVTGKRAADCERILRGLGIASEIDVYLGGDSVPRPKPAPDLAQHAMERLGMRSGRMCGHRGRERRHRDGKGRGRAHDPGALGLRA